MELISILLIRKRNIQQTNHSEEPEHKRKSGEAQTLFYLEDFLQWKTLT
jgi:hypothetical protein